MSAGRKQIVRATALVLAIGINALYWLVLSSQRSRPTPEPVMPAMLWIAALERPRAPPRRAAPSSVRRSNRPATITEQLVSLVQPAPAPAPAPESEPESVPVPPIDWSAARDKVLDDLMHNEELARQAAENSKLKVLVLPPEPAHKKGQTEHFDGGVVRTWVDDLCYYEMDPLQGPGAHRVCKVRTAFERQSEDRAAAIAQAVKSKRSGRKP